MNLAAFWAPDRIGAMLVFDQRRFDQFTWLKDTRRTIREADFALAIRTTDP